MKIRTLPGCGAEVTGLDINALDEGDMGSLKQAFADHGVLFFRDQSVNEEQHLNFARSWGNININRFFAAHAEYPEIAMVSKEPDQTVNIGGGWHTDHSYDIEPALGSILVAKTLPKTGGNTCFANMCKAYDCLSEGLKKTLSGLNAVHSARHVFGAGGKDYQQAVSGRIGNSTAADELTDPVHPMVITHPLSGKKALYINPGFTRHIEGWTLEESAPLLEYLYEFAIQDDFVTEFEWRTGSIAFWDNRATWHLAKNDYQGQTRIMHRITLDGCGLSR